MLIKTERLCKTGYQKCLPWGDSANEVYLLKLPIKVTFSCSFLPGWGNKQNQVGNRHLRVLPHIKVFHQALYSAPQQNASTIGPNSLKVPRHSQGCWCIWTLQAAHGQTELDAAICATCSAAVCSCSTRATFSMVHSPSECILFQTYCVHWCEEVSRSHRSQCSL